MAYLDPQHTHKRLAGATGVALVHIALAFGLVAGLTIKYVQPPDDRNPEVFNVPTTPPPPPEPVPDPQPKLETPRVVPEPVVANPIIDLTHLEPALVTSDIPIHEPTIKLVVPILPTGPVAHALTAQPPRPANGPIGWVTNSDYPQVALRRGWEGDLTYSVDVGADGKVDACRIVNSSGRSVLDDAACRMISRRARFDPATDRSGEVVAGSYRGNLSWTIPED